MKFSNHKARKKAFVEAFTFASLKRIENNIINPGVGKEYCYGKKAATVGQNGRLSASCNFFSFLFIKS